MFFFGQKNSKGTIAIKALILVAFLMLNFVGKREFELNIPTNQKLDKLFEDLRSAPNAIIAQQIEGEIFIELNISKSETINVLMASAQAAIDKEDFENAMISLDEILRREPDFNEARNVKAALLYKFGEKSAALKNLERIIENDDRLNSVWAAIGNIRYELMDIDGARTAFERALFLNPYNDMAKRGLFDIESKTSGIAM